MTARRISRRAVARKGECGFPLDMRFCMKALTLGAGMGRLGQTGGKRV